jgi:hypothetical protein
MYLKTSGKFSICDGKRHQNLKQFEDSVYNMHKVRENNRLEILWTLM